MTEKPLNSGPMKDWALAYARAGLRASGSDASEDYQMQEQTSVSRQQPRS